MKEVRGLRIIFTRHDIKHILDDGGFRVKTWFSQSSPRIIVTL